MRSVQGSRWAREAMDALERAGLAEFAGSEVNDLPYGVQKQIEIARALLGGADVLLLDEPAAGLNPRETEELKERLRGIAGEGRTIVVVEHDMQFVGALCEHVVVLDFGRKIAEGTPAEVRREPRGRRSLPRVGCRVRGKVETLPEPKDLVAARAEVRREPRVVEACLGSDAG